MDHKTVLNRLYWGTRNVDDDMHGDRVGKIIVMQHFVPNRSF